MNNNETHAQAARAILLEALRRQEEALAGDVPVFAQMAARIQAKPSALEAPRWSVARSARLAVDVALAQLRVMPRTVMPAALVVAAAALAGAWFIAAGWGTGQATWWFSAFLLAGVALTVTAALSRERYDALALATPLGPHVVILARLATVLGVDALAGLAASALFVWWGVSLDFAAVVTGWLVPLAAIAGASSFVAVWSGSSWPGAVAGMALVPALLPVGQAAAEQGVFALIYAVQTAIGPLGIAALGAVLLLSAVCSARRAALMRLEVA